MKKLLLILSAVFVSVMAWAQNNADAPYLLNPYAYDLTSSWDESTQKLTINFKLNSAPNLHDTRDANNNAVNGRGIQVFLVDTKNNEYYICGPSQDEIRAAHGRTSGRHGSYSYTIDLTSGVDRNGKLIPRNEDLTWKVKVSGRKNYNAEIANGLGGSQNFSKPRRWLIADNPAYQKRLVSHSIDVVTNPQAPNFGRIMITDGIKVSTDNGWGNAHDDRFYSYTEGRGLYILEPDFVNFANNGKRAALNSNKNGGFVDPLEPREVCVSDDGRIFVSSASASKTSATAVWELSSNYQTWTEILKKATLDDRRVVAMDTKGADDAITLLLLCAPKDANTPLTCWEYSLQNQTLTKVDLPNNVTNITPYVEGINFQAKVQYASNGDIWVGLGNTYGSRVVKVKDNTYRFYGSNKAESWGGEAFVIKDNLMIKSSRTSGDADILFEKLNDGSKYFSENITAEGIGMDAWITDFAIDYADNVFVASNYNGRVIPISMPYDGVRYTPAPSRYKFKLSKAVPNIMAMDLKREPNGNNPSYKFSFVTNAKPTHAEIRFYKKENSAKMFENIKTIHADNYDKGSHTISQPDYVYTFPSTALKQGEMSVILNMVGGERNVQRITNALPPGELYWTVYVEAEKNNAFAPIYHLGGINDGRNHRRHVAVNNYPETDMFGSLIVSDCPVDDVNGAAQGLWIYGFNPSGNCNDVTTAVNDASRYSFRNSYLNGTAATANRLNYPRRVAVAPDGKVYIADEGTTDVPDWKGATDPVMHDRGGLKLWNPEQPNKFELFADNQIKTAYGVAIWKHSDGLKVYSTNTYDEFMKHIFGKTNYTPDQQKGKYGWNGFVEYVIEKYSGPTHTWVEPDSVHYNLGQGDASGNFSLVTMDQGVWMCQHREHTVAIKDKMKESPADNKEANLLAFVPYNSNTRTWISCDAGNGPTNGFTYTDGKRSEDSNGYSPWSQKTDAPMQSTPGAGLAYRVLKDKNGNIISIGEYPEEYPEEYLYVVNHDGNIVQIRISTWKNKGTTSATPGLTYITTLTTPGYIKAVNKATKDDFPDQDWKTSFISSMNFDYAGNLVITASQTRAGASHIIVYTMPYDRTNAQEIRASDDRILIPERLAQFDMTRDDIKGIIEDHKQHQTGTCAIDLYRPMQGGMFNTICLPFNLNLNDIPAKHPLNGVEIKQFKGVKLEEIGGENILTLQFGDVNENTMKANTPHIIKPVNNIKGIMELNWGIPLASDTILTRPNYTFDNDNTITYQGILPKTQVDALYDPTTKLPLRLILVADNRLAVLTGDGDMYGFRGYFDLAKPLPPGTVAKISAKKDTPTNTTIVVDDKKVNIDKYLREGRVYIRVGDSLYTVDGQLVK